MPRDHKNHSSSFSPEVQNTIRLTLAFTKAAAHHQTDKADNLIVSPYNVLSCLAMVAKGAEGKTLDEMSKALFGHDASSIDADGEKLAELNKKILESSKDPVIVKTASNIWSNSEQCAPLSADYIDDVKKTFGSDASAEKFSSPATVKKINKWASDNTNGLIEKIVSNLSSADAAVIASALYMKAPWTNKFDPDMTQEKPFRADQDGPAAGSVTPTMHQDFSKPGKMTYLEGSDFEAVAMTYGESNLAAGKSPSLRMVMVRPKDDAVSARDWLASQDKGTSVPAWLEPSAFEKVRGSVELPRIDVQQKHDIIPVLKDMGIRDAFSQASANFDRMTGGQEPGLFISKATHDIAFKTDEGGSEGAAVTTAVMTQRSIAPPVKNVDIKFDRSFVFVVQDIATGTPLFIGAVNKPNGEMKPVPPPATPKR